MSPCVIFVSSFVKCPVTVHLGCHERLPGRNIQGCSVVMALFIVGISKLPVLYEVPHFTQGGPRRFMAPIYCVWALLLCHASPSIIFVFVFLFVCLFFF